MSVADPKGKIEGLDYEELGTLARLCYAERARIRKERTWRGERRRISNAPLRDAFLESGETASAVARRAGWVGTRRNRPDATRVKRALGLAPEAVTGAIRKTVRYDTAKRLAEAMNLDPVDVGI